MSVSEDSRNNDIVLRNVQFLRVESVQGVFKNLLVKTVDVNSPEVFHMSVIFLIQAVFA